MDVQPLTKIASFPSFVMQWKLLLLPFKIIERLGAGGTYKQKENTVIDRQLRTYNIIMIIEEKV